MTQTTTGISLGGIKKKGGASTKNDHPVYPANEEERAIAQQILDLGGQLEQIEGALKILEGELKSRVSTWFFDHISGKSDVPSSVKVPTTGGALVGVTLMNRYGAVNSTVGDGEAEQTNPKLDTIRRLMGAEAFGYFMEESVNISIDSKKIPAEELQGFINTLLAAAEMHRAMEAISAKQAFSPNSTFHVERHKAFGPDVNKALHKEMPCVVSIRKKGVR